MNMQLASAVCMHDHHQT